MFDLANGVPQLAEARLVEQMAIRCQRKVIWSTKWLLFPGVMYNYAFEAGNLIGCKPLAFFFRLILLLLPAQRGNA